MKSLLVRNVSEMTIAILKLDSSLLGLPLEAYLGALVSGTMRRFTETERTAATSRLVDLETALRSAGKAKVVSYRKGKGKFEKTFYQYDDVEAAYLANRTVLMVAAGENGGNA
jgi:hypothetical protein